MGDVRGSPRASTAAGPDSDRPSEPRAAGHGTRSTSESQVVARSQLEREQARSEPSETRSDVAAVSCLQTPANERDAPASGVGSAHELPDPRAFLRLFHEYERYVASIGSRILGHNNGVDDLVQEVFLVIYQEFHKLQGLSSTKAWLATIATRIAWRQRGRPWLYSKLTLAQVEEISPLESTDASPELQADLAVLLERLRSMPDSLREPWLLRFIDGETLPRIAEVCDCSQSTVQRRLREASEIMLGTRRPDAPPSVID